MIDSAPASAPALFAYGTLQLPVVLERVLGHVPTLAPAVLHGFARRCVRGQRYPAIVERAAEHVEGSVLFGLGPNDWRKLDTYEGNLYSREAVTVMLDDGSALPAQTYVLAPTSLHVLGRDVWSLARFIEQDLAAFLAELDAEEDPGQRA